MLILDEKDKLNEMAMRIISAPKDNLSFKIIIKCPDEGKLDHAHIIKLRTKADEIGAFVITKNTPHFTKDLVGYTEGKHQGLVNLTEGQLQSIVDWASSPNSLFPGTNWQALQYEYAVNRKKA